MTRRFISDWREMYTRTVDLLTDNNPLFLGRVGGSDTDMVLDYIKFRTSGIGSESVADALKDHEKIVRRYNGYYDKARRPENVIRYCETLYKCYEGLRESYLVGALLLTRFFPDNIHPSFHYTDVERGALCDTFMDSLSAHDVTFQPYNFVEKLISHPYSLFNAFSESLAGKKVLVISPFSKTIISQFPKRHTFLLNYMYPEFELFTLNTPITYDGLPEEFYPDSDWFETCGRLTQEISGIDFDVALLSCGSYAMPLGTYIASAMKRKAVYVGGVLQLYFGIMGRRYENVFYTSQINEAEYVRAAEADDFLRFIRVDPTSAKEAFGAYF